MYYLAFTLDVHAIITPTKTKQDTMQIRITPAEQKQLIRLTAAKGRTKWFYERAEIAWHSLQKLRTLGQADEDVVKKARAVLRSKAAKALIEQDMEAMAS